MQDSAQEAIVTGSSGFGLQINADKVRINGFVIHDASGPGIQTNAAAAGHRSRRPRLKPTVVGQKLDQMHEQ